MHGPCHRERYNTHAGMHAMRRKKNTCMIVRKPFQADR
jgi:hypothetical protein